MRSRLGNHGLLVIAGFLAGCCVPGAIVDHSLGWVRGQEALVAEDLDRSVISRGVQKACPALSRRPGVVKFGNLGHLPALVGFGIGTSPAALTGVAAYRQHVFLHRLSLVLHGIVPAPERSPDEFGSDLRTR